MRICISSGHGKYIRGAAGPPPWGLDEVDEARRVVEQVADYLQAVGVGVMTFHDDTSTTQSENLDTIVDFHNSQTRDLDVSVHFNAYETTSKPMGTECLYVTQHDLAEKVASAIADATGLPDRGPKKRTDLAFLNGTNEPAILIETVFCDSSTDAEAYRENFDIVCRAIAEAISGEEIDEPIIPPEPQPEPPEPSELSRPVLGEGDYGPDVALVQQCLGVAAHGYFDPTTKSAVKGFQDDHGLDVDGVVGEQTWAKLDEVYDLPPYPTPLLPPLDQETLDKLKALAADSAIAEYPWRDRGVAPAGYTQGMAIAYATMYRKLLREDPTALECAKANTHDDDVDALSWYFGTFDELGMSNEEAGADTLRHLFVLLMGLGMRESSGAHCEGRDMSASNVSSDTAEAGLFQQSWNSRTCCTAIESLLDEYRSGLGEDDVPQCALDPFREGVSCSAEDWESYGSGDGRDFQDLCKQCPQFAVEAAAVGLRNLRQHWGPINRREVEVKKAADDLLMDVQTIIDKMAPPEPEPEPPEVATVRIETSGAVRVYVNGQLVTPVS